MGELQVIVDGQYGSCGKGAVAAYLAQPQHTKDGIAAVRVAGPNAGHSAVDPQGRKWALRCIPVAAVVNPDARLYLAAGSEIDMDVLCTEADALEAGGHRVYERLVIDQMATVLEPHHRDAEAAQGLVGRVGSTGKGIGAARADRIMRTARTIRDLGDQGLDGRLTRFAVVSSTANELRRTLDGGATVQIEGTQGYGLGLHHPNYPQVTSSDCRAIDFLAMAGISPWDNAVDALRVWLVLRPYPIRVAGNSGPLHGETTWEALGLPQERTTVTQKIRRVGTWDPQLARAAVRANGGEGNPKLRVAITMLDQISPALDGCLDRNKILDDPAAISFLERAQTDLRHGIHLVGTSDRTMVRL